MSRLRIAVVTPELPNREYPYRGGSVYQTLRHLGRCAELQALCPLPRYPAGFRPRFDYRESDLSYSLPEVETRYFAYPVFPVLTRPVNGFTCAHYLEPYIRAFRPDVILNYWLYPAGFAALNVGRKLRVPVVVGSMGSDLNGIPDRVSKWLTRRTLQGASQVIAKSDQLRGEVLAMGIAPEKTHVVANGCDDDLFQVRDRASARHELNVPDNAELVVFVGRMHRGKGVHELLDAVVELFAARPRLRLVYVGDGPELSAVKEKVQAGNLSSKVSLAGSCSSPQVARWFAASNLLVLPSYAEGCPNVVIEALSCGRPVVATSVGALPDLIDHSCGILVPVGNIEALTNALTQALNSSWDEEAISKRVRRTWQQVALEVLAICEASRSLVQGRSRHN